MLLLLLLLSSVSLRVLGRPNSDSEYTNAENTNYQDILNDVKDNLSTFALLAQLSNTNYEDIFSDVEDLLPDISNTNYQDILSDVKDNIFTFAHGISAFISDPTSPFNYALSYDYSGLLANTAHNNNILEEGEEHTNNEENQSDRRAVNRIGRYSYEDLLPELSNTNYQDILSDVKDNLSTFAHGIGAFISDPTSPFNYALSYDYSGLLASITGILAFLVNEDSPGYYIYNYDYSSLFSRLSTHISSVGDLSGIGSTYRSLIEDRLGADIAGHLGVALLVIVAGVASLFIVPLIAFLSSFAFALSVTTLLGSDIAIAKLIEQFKLLN